MNQKVKILGLIGFPLGHSFSERFFGEKFRTEQISDYQYRLFPLPDLSGFTGLLKEFPELVGLNVTIPYKESIIPLLSELDSSAAGIGAVNVIKINRSADSIRLKGYNTDLIGFGSTFDQWMTETGKSALIFGTGGSSKAVQKALRDRFIPYTLVSRKPAANCLGYEDITPQMIRENKILINTTPLGMYPNEETRVSIPYDCITPGHWLFDLVYNPEVTSFLSEGLKRGASICNGLGMLHEQAEASWKIWTEERFI